MNRTITTLLTAVILILNFSSSAHCGDQKEALIIDHHCTGLSAIPSQAINAAKDSCKWHYGRMSHGRQIMVGLSRIESSDPFYQAAWPAYGGSLPRETDALCIYTAAIGPESYWRGSGIDNTRSVLDENPSINISGFCWCTQLNTASHTYVQNYLEAMQTLENEYPGVTFIYFTGTAEYDGAYGYNRAMRNRQIREFCLANNKVLYDFENLDSWWFNPDRGEWEQSTYQYNGEEIPVEHPSLAGNDAEHTSYQSCEQKGKATWWLMATLAGWSGTMGVEDQPEQPSGQHHPATGMNCYPNPCNPCTTIKFTLEKGSMTDISIYDISGRRVKTLLNRLMSEGEHSVVWKGVNQSGRRVASGVYFYRLRTGKKSLVKKVLLMH